MHPAIQCLWKRALLLQSTAQVSEISFSYLQSLQTFCYRLITYSVTNSTPAQSKKQSSMYKSACLKCPALMQKGTTVTVCSAPTSFKLARSQKNLSTYMQRKTLLHFCKRIQRQHVSICTAEDGAKRDISARSQRHEFSKLALRALRRVSNVAAPVRRRRER